MKPKVGSAHVGAHLGISTGKYVKKYCEIPVIHRSYTSIYGLKTDETLLSKTRERWAAPTAPYTDGPNKYSLLSVRGNTTYQPRLVDYCSAKRVSNLQKQCHLNPPPPRQRTAVFLATATRNRQLCLLSRISHPTNG